MSCVLGESGFAVGVCVFFGYIVTIRKDVFHFEQLLRDCMCLKMENKDQGSFYCV